MKWLAIVVMASVLSTVAVAQPAPLPANGSGNGSAAGTVVQGVDRPSAPELMGKAGGSLLRASVMAGPDPARAKLSGVSFYAVPEPEPKTVKKHDFVTIVIREETEYSSDGTSDLKKSADFDAGITQMIKTKSGWPFVQGGAITDPAPQITMAGKRNFKGEATMERTDTFVTRITAEVVDVKPNGTFAVQARKRIKHDEEEQEYTLTGMCRAGDLTPDNTILSTQMHDLSIELATKGAVRDTTKRGWVPKLLDFVNPF